YESLNELVQELLGLPSEAGGQIPTDLLGQLASYLPAETLVELQQLAQNNLTQAVDQTINYLLDRHGTGRVLFRNTRNSVAGFPERKLHQHLIELTDEHRHALLSLPLTQQLRAEDYWKKAAPQNWWLE